MTQGQSREASSGRLAVSHPYPPSYRQHPSPAPSYPTTMPPPSAYGYQNTEQHDRYMNTPSPQPDHVQPLYSADPAIPMTRLRSESDSSHHEEISDKKWKRWKMGKKGKKSRVVDDEYPPGWTKEDEEAEAEFLKQSMFNWRELVSWRFWIRKEWWYWYVALVILAVLVILMTLYHDDIVDWLEPVVKWMQNLPAGWTIPIAVLFILSFPPLFGQEIVAILCGVVWGLWIGFGIVAAGTMLGEIGNFYAFKYWCRARAEKYERNNLNYAIMAYVVRDGGFFFIFIARLSAIPGHFTTAVFSTAGVNIWVFTIATLLTMPKQLIIVYLGVIFKEQEKSTKSKIISYVVLIVGGLLTVLAAYYIYYKMNKARLIVWRKQRMALAAKGVSIDPVTGVKRHSTFKAPAVKGPLADEEQEMRSPILAKHTSYQNPYDIRYQTSDNMSVYHVDGPLQPPQGERDLGGGYNNAFASTESFPQAQPFHQAKYGVRRQNSSSSALSGPPEGLDRIATDFPIPQPIPHPAPMGNMDYGREQGYAPQAAQPQGHGYR